MLRLLFEIIQFIHLDGAWDTFWKKSLKDGILPQKSSNFMHGLKSAILANFQKGP